MPDRPEPDSYTLGVATFLENLVVALRNGGARINMIHLNRGYMEENRFEMQLSYSYTLVEMANRPHEDVRIDNTTDPPGVFTDPLKG